MQVRPLGPADARAYQRLRLQALQESPTAFSASLADEAGRSVEEMAARITPAADGSDCRFGVFEQDQLAGLLAVIQPQRAKQRHCVELAGLYVAPAYRRRGVARMLLEAAMSHVQTIAGVRQIRLGVNASNVGARALHESFGFAGYGVEPDALQIDGTFYGEAHHMLRITPVPDHPR